MSGLRIEGVSLHYGTGPVRFQALDQVDLQISSGTFVTLLGPSGSGKTTLLRCIAGLVSPSAGRIMADDRLFYDAATSTGLPTRHRNLGMVFQAFALWPHMTVAANVGFPLKLRGWSTEKRNARVDELLELVGLPGLGGRYPTQLSGGQQQRVGLARAISCEPSLLLMDEPLSSLDARLREEMRAHIRRLQKTLGITVIYVTHDREEALGLSDVVVILSRGKMVAKSTPQDLYRRPMDSFTATFLSGWSKLGGVTALSARQEGRWVERVQRQTSCSCGGNCAVMLPMEMSEPRVQAPASDHTHISAEIMNVEFLGSSVRVELRLPGADRTAFVTQSGAAADSAIQLARGAHAGVPLRDFRILCQPEFQPFRNQGGTD